MIIEQRVRLTYPPRLLNQPLVHGLISQFSLLINILEARVGDEGGWLVIALRGEEVQVREGLAWVKAQGVQVEVLSQDGEQS